MMSCEKYLHMIIFDLKYYLRVNKFDLNISYFFLSFNNIFIDLIVFYTATKTRYETLIKIRFICKIRIQIATYRNYCVK